jgi:putative glutamine amidotransferase
MKNMPLIGVTPSFDYAKETVMLHESYTEGVNSAGGLAFILSPSEDEKLLHRYLDGCDGLLLTGGADIDAMYYGEENLPYSQEISPVRDFMEIFLVRKAVELNKPVLGICRGIQVINAALGGTLFQDIYAQIPGKNILKHSQEAPRWYPVHEISIVPGSRVFESFGRTCVKVNSFHHQAVRDPAPGFAVTSRSSDGIIESIEHFHKNFVVGVQWHPERMFSKDEAYLGIFRSFVDACKTAAFL